MRKKIKKPPTVGHALFITCGEKKFYNNKLFVAFDIFFKI